MMKRCSIACALVVVGLMAFAALPKAGGTEFCNHTGDKRDGLNKICFYKCPSGEVAITIKSTDLCPISLKH